MKTNFGGYHVSMNSRRFVCLFVKLLKTPEVLNAIWIPTFLILVSVNIYYGQNHVEISCLDQFD